MADASITPAPVTVAGGLAGVGKVYDGMDSALIASNGVVLAGILAGDAGRVGLSTNGYSARFPGPGAGSNLTVRVENLSLTGDLAGNYALVQPVLLGGVDLRAQTPVVAAAPTAAPLVYGQALSASLLSGGTVTNAVGDPLAGGFQFVAPGLRPAAGTTAAAVVFTGSDSLNYTAPTGTVSVVVGRAVPLLAASPLAAPITYGQSLGASALSGGLFTNASSGAVVPGSLAFANPAIQPLPGVTNADVIFTPDDGADYQPLTFTLGVTVGARTLVITAGPTNKVYGSVLALSAQGYSVSGLTNGDAVASVSLASDGLGAAAGAGAHAIVPSAAQGTGLERYEIRYVSGTLTVERAPVTIINVSASGKVYDGTDTAALGGGAVSGALNGDVVVFTPEIGRAHV